MLKFKFTFGWSAFRSLVVILGQSNTLFDFLPRLEHFLVFFLLFLFPIQREYNVSIEIIQTFLLVFFYSLDIHKKKSRG